MRLFLVLLGREIKAYFYSPVAYVVMFCFLVLTGGNFYLATSVLNRNPTQFTVVEVFFNSVPFWILLILSFPLITMRLFSEEYKLGTIESLMTAPVKDWQVVLSKFGAAYFFYIMLWLPSVFYFPIFEWITKTHATYSVGSYVGSFTFTLLIGMFYISIGCLASALTSNQIVAAIGSITVLIMLFLSGMLFLLKLNITPVFREFVGYFSSMEHMLTFSGGVFDTRPFIYYFSMTIFTLMLTYKVFQYRRWKA